MGLARVYLEAFGCSSNVADSEMVAGLLEKAGHTIIKYPEMADVSIVLSCTVKKPTERKVVKRIQNLSAKGVPLVVAGCMPKAQGELVAETAPEACMLGPNDLFNVVDVVEAALEGRRVEEVSDEPFDKVCLPRVRRNPVIHIAPISSGCLGSCSYCIVRRARGRLHSFPADMIVDDARRALDEGCREIWVTAEDTAAYRWGDVRLPRLLEDLSELDGEFRVRVGMMTPNEAEPILDDLVEAYSSGKVFKFLHAPVQSGNDGVLRRMRRRYTVDRFRRLVARFREVFPLMSLSTDIICGFPGETEEQFDDSMRLVREITPDFLNISRFWPRPDTEAAEFDDQLHGRETKRRSRMLTDLWRVQSLEWSRRWIKWRGRVIIDEEGRGDSMIGRNFAYKPVVIQEHVGLGDFVDATVTDVRRGYLLGETC